MNRINIWEQALRVFGKTFGCVMTCSLFLLFSCQKKQEAPKLFELKDSKETGITFRNDLISTDSVNILEYLYFYNGGGVAAGDINNDGLVDLYFTSNQGENKLYLNKGDFRFEDITVSAGVTGEGGWSTGVTMADVNGDGLLDIYVCQVGDYKGIKGKNRLYINNGDLTFTESAAKYGLDFVGFSTHAVFFDYDQDGDLDLYLLNHSIKKPEVFSHADTKFTNQDEKGGDKLFQSLVAQGEMRMVEVTEEAGILSSSLGFGLGVGVADLNGDGWLDIYVSNDFTEDDYLYINQQDGTFKESLGEFISNTSRYSMGNDINDLNNDGLPDIFSTDMLPEDPEIWMKSVGEDKQEVFAIKEQLGYKDQFVRNHLQLNRPDGRFSEIGLLTGTFATDWSWSPLIFDMDNDGHKDIHVTNGIVKRPNDLDFIQYSQTPQIGLSEREIQQKQIEMLPSVKLPNYAFKNHGRLVFKEMAKELGLGQHSYSNGSTYADLDNDGDLDLIINNTDQEAFVYENRANLLEHHFIQLDLKGKGANTFGIGASVWVFTPTGMQHQTLSTSRGFQSGTSTTLTFGLGEVDQIDSVWVQWSAQEIEVFYELKVDERQTLEVGKGKRTDIPQKPSNPIFEIVDVGLDWKHEENKDFDEFRREYLLPRRYATEGPALAVGDVNGDGLDDVFLGGAKGQAGSLWLQGKDGKMILSPQPIFDQMKNAEDVVAILEDFNGDGHLDLYVGSGGNEHATNNLYNFDRVYLNDGKGNFIFSMNSLPPIGQNTSTVAVHDVNGDGFPDLFVGASVVSGNYGAIPNAHLLLNDGKGRFRDATAEYFDEDFKPGMLQEACWVDLDGDGVKELLLAGEWMPIMVYHKGTNGRYEEGKSLVPTGWYTGLKVHDLDADGIPEIILGNNGLNSKLKPTSKKPLVLYHGDFDGNGAEEAILFHRMKDFLVPFPTRDDLIKQLPQLKRQHGSYKEYAQIRKPEDLFAPKVLNEKRQLKTEEFQSGILKNGSRAWEFEPFAVGGQLSPLRDFVTFSAKGEQYVLGLGNFFGFRNDLGTSGAQALWLAKWVKGELIEVPIGIPGNQYWGEFRRGGLITINGKNHIIALRNNDFPVIFRIDE